jgi:multidrug transporter EmrE-like cation transporter
VNPVWLLFLPLTAAMAAGAYSSYHEGFKRGPYFVPLFFALQLTTGSIWIAGARALGPRQLFTFNMLWDAAAVGTFCLIPLVAFGVQLRPLGWAGLSLVVLGSILVKVSE